MSATNSALEWADLGEAIRSDLDAKGLDAAWFSSKGKDPDLRRTVLTLYVKMAGMTIIGKRLWDFVGKQAAVTKGRLEFIATPNVEVFMHALESSPTFTNPGKKPVENWDSREFVPTCNSTSSISADGRTKTRLRLTSIHRVYTLARGSA